METAAFSDLLLALYRAAATTPVKTFRRMTLETVRRHLPFDAALWATTGVNGGTLTRHVWVIDGASEELIPLLHAHAGHTDMILRELCETPGKTLIFRPEDLPLDPMSAQITALSGMRHVAATAAFDDRLGIHHILTLGRRDADRPFLVEEQALKQMITPHLEAMVARNFEAQFLAAMIGQAAGTVGTAMTSDDAVLLAAEPNFVELLRSEWPAWSGPALPAPLAQAVREGRQVLLRRHVTLHLSRRQRHVLLIASRHSAIDLLTRKEYQVAADFAVGNSYKEVARMHGLSPETVRSRLRTVYEKLGIGDKGELSRYFEQNKLLENLQELL